MSDTKSVAYTSVDNLVLWKTRIVTVSTILKRRTIQSFLLAHNFLLGLARRFRQYGEYMANDEAEILILCAVLKRNS